MIMVRHTSFKSNTIRCDYRSDKNDVSKHSETKVGHSSDEEENITFNQNRHSKVVKQMVPGKYLERISLITGILALLFALLPVFLQGLVIVFWLFVFWGVISVCTGIVSFFFRRFCLPLLGIFFSVVALVTAVVCAPIYAVSLASSVNAFLNLLKTFIDVLIWPF